MTVFDETLRDPDSDGQQQRRENHKPQVDAVHAEVKAYLGAGRIDPHAIDNRSKLSRTR